MNSKTSLIGKFNKNVLYIKIIVEERQMVLNIITGKH